MYSVKYLVHFFTICFFIQAIKTSHRIQDECVSFEPQYDCLPRCQVVCRNYNHRINRATCLKQCVVNCVCRGGFVRLNNGRCLSSKDCGQTQCPNNLVYKTCGSACEKTCENLNGPPKACAAVCVKGCFCPDGLVKYRNSICIRPEQCHAIDACDRLGPQRNCFPPCQNLCYRYVGVYRATCLKRCITNCVCKRGGWVRINGRCLTSKDCKGGSGGCRPDQQYYDCTPECPNTCELYGKRDVIKCAAICKPGCFCKPGLVLRSDGACVPYALCPQGGGCRPDQQYYDCTPECPNTCELYGKREVIRCGACKPGCFCKPGLVLRSDGACIPYALCPQANCGPTQSYYECKPTCKNTCENYQAVNPICTKICIKGCACKQGLVLRKDGQCVEPKDCNQGTCPGNLVYNDCGTACPKTCDNYNENTACTLQCVPGCFCPPGLVKLNNNLCVLPTQCPPKQCPNNLVYKTCGSACEKTCENLNGPPMACAAVCVKGCFCPDGLVKLNGNTCVLPSLCPNAQKCPNNLVYKTCGSACEKTCENLNGPPMACAAVCVKGCFCSDGLVKLNGNACVRPSLCPNTPQCPINEEYVECEQPKTGCVSCTHKEPCETFACNPGCNCKAGYFRETGGMCTPEAFCSIEEDESK